MYGVVRVKVSFLPYGYSVDSSILYWKDHPFTTAVLLFSEIWSRCYRKGDLFQGLRVGSCVTFGNELSEEIRVLTKQEPLLLKGAWVESRRIREPRRIYSAMWLVVLYFVVSFQVVYDQSSLVHSQIQGPSCGTLIFQPRWVPAQRILGYWLSPHFFGPSWILVSFWR